MLAFATFAAAMSGYFANMKNRFVWVALAGFMLGLGEAHAQGADTTSTLSIVAVGDLMLGTNYPNSSYLPPEGGRLVLADVNDLLSSADLTFGNLEGVLMGAKGTVAKRCSDPAKCYAFKSPDDYVWHLERAGIDMVSLANNHANDFGMEGKQNTMMLLDSAGIAYAGLDEFPSCVVERDGLRVGMTAFSPNRGSLQIADLAGVSRRVKELKATCDMVIVSFHGGAEGIDHRHVRPGTEMYLGENRGDPMLFARTAIDAGADLVLGHGPHVPRAVDLYHDRFIIYSLGNFATYGRFSLRGQKGLAPILEIELNRDGTFIRAKIHSAIQRGEGGPSLDPEQRALHDIRGLTQADCPQSGLVFQEDGSILPPSH